ncbi:MAG: IclR family transcriptional regulator [Actinomycetota bacterium]|nr:IclR family transcriptional regulator [Actinomycetota bacterium]
MGAQEGVGGVPSAAAAAAGTPRSQTLDRGLRVLEVLAEGSGPLTVAELTRALGVHRSIVYRIVRTLEDHRLVARDGDGGWQLGVGLSALARGVSRPLQSAALPDLSELANDLGMTAFLVVPDRDEAVTLVAVEPRDSHAHIAYRPGVRHPVSRGAPGLALLSGGPRRAGERPEVALARRRGWAWSRGEVIPGLSSVAVPVSVPAQGVVAAVCVVYADENADEEAVAARLAAAARRIAAELS